MLDTIRIHPDNPKVFDYDGRPRVLICATEHYGAVMNRPFRFERYLADAKEKNQTFTRLFTLFRELQTPVNPYSSCKPESPDFVAPFLRTGPERALDGQPKYDLEQWNPEFFDRLHAFLSMAEEYRIAVEVVMFSNTYKDEVWALNPLNPSNNITMESESIRWQEYMTCRIPELLQWQRRHLERIVNETNRYSNVIYEICNEPCHFPGDEGLPSAEEVNAWQSQFIVQIREIESGLSRRHLIAGQEAMTIRPFEQGCDRSFDEMDFDIVNIHPLPNTIEGGRSHDMGEFMAKELKLNALRDFALRTHERAKPLNYDEDNAATQYKEVEGWTVHRKRAWTAVMSGAHYDMIDFSIVPYLETGTDASQAGIRKWMAHLSTFVHSIDLSRARPLEGWVKGHPDECLVSVLAAPGEDYCVYLADRRELTDPGSGDPIEGSLLLDFPEGAFEASCFSPETGVYSPSVPIDGGDGREIKLPAFRNDIAVRLKKA